MIPTWCTSQRADEGKRREFAREAAVAREQLAELYTRHAAELFRYFWVHTRSRAEAEDLVSETFLRALGSLSGYSMHRGVVAGWLYGIARHALATRRKAVSLRAASARAETLPAHAADQPAPTLEERIDLWDALDELTLSEQEVIALKFGAGLTNKDIAEVTGLREAHVGVILYRALQQLRTHLHDEETSHEEQ